MNNRGRLLSLTRNCTHTYYTVYLVLLESKVLPLLCFYEGSIVFCGISMQ